MGNSGSSGERETLGGTLTPTSSRISQALTSWCSKYESDSQGVVGRWRGVQTGGSMAENVNPQHYEHTRQDKVLGDNSIVNMPEIAADGEFTEPRLPLATGPVTICAGGVTVAVLGPK